MLIKYPEMLTKLKWSYLGPQKRPLDCQIKLKLRGNFFYQTSLVKYLEIKFDQFKFDQFRNWQDHINNIAIKLNKTNAVLYSLLCSSSLLKREL